LWAKRKANKGRKKSPSPKNGIQLGTIDTLHSKFLNQERELVIYIPESAKDPQRKRDKYPCCISFKGQLSFSSICWYVNTMK